MSQQDSQGAGKPSHPSPARLLESRRVITAGAACLVVGLGLGFVGGQQRSAGRDADVRCLSAPGTISCTDDADTGHGEFWVPRDIAWTDTGGSLHIGGRPDCLPPTGRGAEGPVRITWAKVEVSGTSWKQAVGVTC